MERINGLLPQGFPSRQYPYPQRQESAFHERQTVDVLFAEEPDVSHMERTKQQRGSVDNRTVLGAYQGKGAHYTQQTSRGEYRKAYVCPTCHGAGFLRRDVPFGHPHFGKPIACTCKEVAYQEKRRVQLFALSNLDVFRDRCFQTYNPHICGVRQAYQAARDFAAHLQGWLLLVGPNGCGKTHLAAAIANQALEEGRIVLFESVPDLLDHLRATFVPTTNVVYDQLFSTMREAELLVLDDLGSQQSTPWASEKLFQLLNYRYNLALPTVMTMNPQGLLGVDERVMSRLGDRALVHRVMMDRVRDYRQYHARKPEEKERSY